MSLSAQNTSLSLSARLLCYLGPPSAILLTSLASQKTALFSTFAFLPAALFYSKWRKSNKVDPTRRGELEAMIWIYASVGTLGLFSAALVQALICKAGSPLILGSGEMSEQYWKEFARTTIAGLTSDELALRAGLAASWQNWVFNGVFTFVAAGLVEETLKYLPIAYARRREAAKQRQPRKRAYIDYAVAGALSFGVIENIAYLYVACEQQNESWSKLLLTTFQRTVVGQLGHSIVVSLTALRAIRRDYYGDPLNWWQVIGPAILYHGASNFVALSASALEGNVGWIHPTGMWITTAMFGLYGGVFASAAWQVKREWKALDKRDRRSKFIEDDGAQR